jgi:ribosomal RNA-processing protein 9
MSNSKKQKYTSSSSSLQGGSKRVKHTKADFSSGGWDDDVNSDDDAFSGDGGDANESSDESLDARESAEQKRRRLAKEYLASMNADESSNSDDNDSNEDEDGNNDHRSQAISSKLRKERLDAGGRYFRNLSGAVESNQRAIMDAPRNTIGGFDLSVTSVALATDEKFVLAGSKDNSVVRIDVETQQKQVLKSKWNRTHEEKQSSEGEILSVAISTDGRYSVSGGRDSKIRIYDARVSNAEVKVLTGHRGAVTSLAFRRESYSLFSGSLDRCLKHWDLSEMGYLETMFGHQDAVTAVDCWTQERPISTSTDRTCRLWRVSDESHLVFRGHKSSADSVQLLTDDTFITGGQDGALHVWKESQKKPVATATAAHGYESACNPNWISALATIKMSNIAVSGSCDGSVRLWNASAESRVLNEVATLATEGFINSIAISPRVLVLGTGREHRWGRWWCMKGNKNKVSIMKFPTDLDLCIPLEDGEQFDDEDSQSVTSSGSDSQEDDDEEEGEVEDEEEEDGYE